MLLKQYIKNYFKFLSQDTEASANNRGTESQMPRPKFKK